MIFIDDNPEDPLAKAAAEEYRATWLRRRTKPHSLPAPVFDEIDGWRRAGGDVVCSCGEVYYQHPADPDFDWLNVLCNGDRVKL